MRYFLGVDGGQSSTTALIADENGRVVGHGRGGPCNHASGAEGRAKFFRAVGGCLDQATANLEQSAAEMEFESAYLGFSGGAADKEGYVRQLVRSRRLTVTHDAEIALAGATGGSPGIIIIAGTGSMAFGKNAEGRTSRAGGWGYIFGDEGGGFDLTRRALRAILRHEEGWGPATSLRETLLNETQSADANTLLHRFYTSDFSRPQIAALSKLVDAAAAAGDAVGLQILKEAAGELAGYVEGVYRNLFSQQEKPVVACIGGVFRSELLRGFFENATNQSIGVTPQKALFSPAAGALLEALRAGGRPASLSNVPESEK